MFETANLKMSPFDKVSILENINDMYICSNCCNDSTKTNHPPFTTSNPSLFLEHQRCHHSSSTEFECIYCCSRVLISSSIQHINKHFDNHRDSLECAAPNCSMSINLNVHHLVKHVYIHHSMDNIVCPACGSQFNSVQEVYTHLIEHAVNLFHCPADNCFAKTHSKDLMLSHLFRKHNGGSNVMRIGIQFLCSENGAQKAKSCNCAITDQNQCNQQVKSTVPTNTNHSTDTYNGYLLPKSFSPLIKNVENTNNKTQTNTEAQRITLPFSNRVLAKLSQNIDEKIKEDLINKMNHYSSFQVKLEVDEETGGQKQFVCATCGYRSVHSLADVRKHILGCHCSVSTSYTRLCLRASRLDTNTFQLFSDKKLISFANEKLKRSDQIHQQHPLNTGEDTPLSIISTTTSQITTQLLEDSEPDSDSQTDAAISSVHNTPNAKKRTINALLESGAKTNKNGTTPKKPRAPYNSGIPSRRPYRQHNRYNNGLTSNGGSNSLHPNMLLRPDSPVPEVGQPLTRVCPIEREINLAYSWSVLHNLIQGHCPEDYLPVLKAKMDVYSSHKILLSRRPSDNPADKSPGKRFFLCSHCSNSSPHGMNDIRKHILGVHARLPERFKSAAMYCSRMNRENYALLSDEELSKKNPDIAIMRAAALPANSSASAMNGVSLVKRNNSITPSLPETNNNFESSPPGLPQFLSDLSAAFLQQQQTFNTSHFSFPSLSPTSHLQSSSPTSLSSAQPPLQPHITNSSLSSTSPPTSLSSLAVAMATSAMSSNWSHADNDNSSINSFLQPSNHNSFLQQPPIMHNSEDYKLTTNNAAIDFSANPVKSVGNKGKSRRSLVLKSKIENMGQKSCNENSESIPNEFNN